MAFYSVNQRRRAIGVTLDFSSFFFFLSFSFFFSLNFSYILYRQINSAIHLLLKYDERNLYAFRTACLEERNIPSCLTGSGRLHTRKCEYLPHVYVSNKSSQFQDSSSTLAIQVQHRYCNDSNVTDITPNVIAYIH